MHFIVHIDEPSTHTNTRLYTDIYVRAYTDTHVLPHHYQLSMFELFSIVHIFQIQYHFEIQF